MVCWNKTWLDRQDFFLKFYHLLRKRWFSQWKEYFHIQHGIWLIGNMLSCPSPSVSFSSTTIISIPNGQLSPYPGRTGGRKRFWSQLNNSKTVNDIPCVSMWSKYLASYRTSLSPTPMSLLSPKPWVEKSPFQISANR